MNRNLVNDDKDDDEDKTKKKICSIAPLNVVDIHEMIMDKTNNEEELRKIELKLELIFERIFVPKKWPKILTRNGPFLVEFGLNCAFGPHF